MKKVFYGADANAPPAMQHATMIERMRELIDADQLDAFAKPFPHGFGTMLETVRSWA